MSTGTRAASAASSRQAKQELVRLLFGKKYNRTGPEGHQKLDYASYSFSSLKKAYLHRLHELHPDKNNVNNSYNNAEELKRGFQELNDAWTRYEELSKVMNSVGNGSVDNPIFTKFGVGCSFSDSEEERALRNEITDQACRGWFSSGLLEEAAASNDKLTNNTIHQGRPSSLLDESLFEEINSDQDEKSSSSQEEAPRKGKPKHLIPGL